MTSLVMVLAVVVAVIAVLLVVVLVVGMRLMRRLPKAVAAEPVAVSETSGVLTEKDRQENDQMSSHSFSLGAAKSYANRAFEETLKCARPRGCISIFTRPEMMTSSAKAAEGI